MKEFYLKAKQVVFADRVKPATLYVRDGKIKAILPYETDCVSRDWGDNYLIPGLFDSHTHGFGGYSFTATLKKAQIAEVKKYYASEGVTRFHATCSFKALPLFASLVKSGEVRGIHVEGPFLNDARFGAAKPGTVFKKPDLKLLKELLDAAPGAIRCMTLAYEIPGNDLIAHELKRQKIKAACGHSNLTYADFLKHREDIDLLTHLGNAMSGIHHREMGLFGAGLLSDIPSELIADGRHIKKEMLTIIFKCKALKELFIVSDSCALAGLASGHYQLVNGAIDLTQDGVMINEFGHLAGSSKSILYALKYLKENFDFALPDLVAMASLNPARFYGYRDIGEIAVDQRADLVVLDRDFRVLETYCDGALVYERTTVLKPNPLLGELLTEPEYLNFYQ